MEQAHSDPKVDSYKIGVGRIQELMPTMVEAYHNFTGICFDPGALEAKHKQLIALGISLFANNEVCTYYHVQEAIASGASQQEVMEAMAVASAVGSGHTLSQGATRVQQALETLTAGTQ
ncbi:carboxymuconolactone decarboxylase family protein [Paenibacillus validus]|uniref:Carboxymuconolactone decarboxylase family protein n=1 Tax=Paenibacillus validus TaxID=44253 RepID=A0A7X2ZB28_9BACL|nr:MULTISPECIES: carboxymuconolactone decarboxylase family protein [Paenibacillus]MED4601605.1 carboxymuconolactone decarboxylase family protein [Paenibacillus validus]MED4607609.1 carboxymuconolactone decarboxylase family protein [Paenibacillus validus]MUG71629.1 carboxymuconolactone decarboxylase family protein [Paenibacillus validus]